MPADLELDVDLLADALHSGEPARQLAAIDALLECDRRGPLADELCGPLLDALGHERKAVQRTAAEALALWSRITPEIPDHLRRLAHSGPLRHRFGAAFALAKLGPDPATLPVLLETLGEADGDMRWAAAGLIVDLVRRQPDMRSQLLALAGGGSAGQRKMALYCLRDLGTVDDELEGILLGDLAHEDGGVRMAALAALGRLLPGSRASLGAVRATAEGDPDMGVRRAAVSRLADFPASAEDAEVQRMLTAAAASDDPGLRRAAEAARRRAARTSGDGT